jgi:hypothetical protein
MAQPTGDGGGGSSCVLGPLCGLGDLGHWLQQTITNILTDVLTGLATNFGDAIVGFINQVNFLTHTPEDLSYKDDLVKQFVTATQVLADGLLAVVVLVSGYNIMLRPYMGGTYAGALEFLPRLLLGGILINTAAWWCRLAIDANNAACGVFGAPTIADMVATILRVTLDPTHLSGLLMVLVFIESEQNRGRGTTGVRATDGMMAKCLRRPRTLSLWCTSCASSCAASAR